MHMGMHIKKRDHGSWKKIIKMIDDSPQKINQNIKKQTSWAEQSHTQDFLWGFLWVSH